MYAPLPGMLTLVSLACLQHDVNELAAAMLESTICPVQDYVERALAQIHSENFQGVC